MAKTTIEFSETAIAQLDQLTDTLHATSKAEILRNALSLYTYIVHQLQGQPGIMLGFVNESQGNKVEKLVAVPGVQQLGSANNRVAS